MNKLDTQAESISALCLNKVLPNVMTTTTTTGTNRGRRDQTVDFINVKDSFFHRKQSILA